MNQRMFLLFAVDELKIGGFNWKIQTIIIN